MFYNIDDDPLYTDNTIFCGGALETDLVASEKNVNNLVGMGIDNPEYFKSNIFTRSGLASDRMNYEACRSKYGTINISGNLLILIPKMLNDMVHLQLDDSVKPDYWPKITVQVCANDSLFWVSAKVVDCCLIAPSIDEPAPSMGDALPRKTYDMFKFAWAVPIVLWIFQQVNSDIVPYLPPRHCFVIADAQAFDYMGIHFNQGLYLAPLIRNIGQVVVHEDISTYTMLQRTTIMFLRTLIIETDFNEFGVCICMFSRWLCEKERSINDIIRFMYILDEHDEDYIEAHYMTPIDDWPFVMAGDFNVYYVCDGVYKILNIENKDTELKTLIDEIVVRNTVLRRRNGTKRSICSIRNVQSNEL